MIDAANLSFHVVSKLYWFSFLCHQASALHLVQPEQPWWHILKFGTNVHMVQPVKCLWIWTHAHPIPLFGTQYLGHTLKECPFGPEVKLVVFLLMRSHCCHFPVTLALVCNLENDLLVHFLSPLIVKQLKYIACIYNDTYQAHGTSSFTRCKISHFKLLTTTVTKKPFQKILRISESNGCRYRYSSTN